MSNSVLPRMGKRERERERERENYRLLVFLSFLFGEVPLPLGTWESLRYFIVALPPI